jgi:ribonuclease III
MGDMPGTGLHPPDSLADLEASFHYRFRDRNLLLRALTHRSFVYEHEGEELQHNEALEFLGDAVLGFLVSSEIFRSHPDFNEGELSKIKAYLVSEVHLVRLAERSGIGKHIRLSQGEEKTEGRKKRAILVDAYEALIGAIYLDGGIEAAAQFLEIQLAGVMEELDLTQITCGDSKSALQERLHSLGLPGPVYSVLYATGPDHRKTFTVQVSVGGRVVAESSGRTKKEAQQGAARLALEAFKSWNAAGIDSPGSGAQ